MQGLPPDVTFVVIARRQFHLGIIREPKNPNWNWIMLLAQKASAVGEWATLRMLWRREWLARPLCRNRVRSEPSACRSRAWRARACRASRSVQHARLRPEIG